MKRLRGNKNYKHIVASIVSLKKILTKISRHDVYDRDYAILIINGEIYTGNTHGVCVQQYIDHLNEEGYNIDNLKRPFFRPAVDGLPGNDEGWNEVGFAHMVTDQSEENPGEYKQAIYLETTTLENMDEDDAVAILKQRWPDLPIYDDDNENDFPDENDFSDDNESSGYRLLIATRLKRKSRNNHVIKPKFSFFNKLLARYASHDVYDRDYAILIINGKIYTGETHGVCVQEYINDLKEEGYDVDDLGDTFHRPAVDVLFDEDDWNKIAFAHMALDENVPKIEQTPDNIKLAIYVEEYTLQNMTQVEAANILKQQWPDLPIYDDDDPDVDLYEDFIQYKRIAKRLAQQTSNKRVLFVVDVQRDYMQYINEELFNAIKSYVTSGNWDEVVVVVDENYGDPEIPDWLQSAATDIIIKSYGSIDEEEIADAIDEGEMVEENDAWRDRWGNLIVPTSGMHDNFTVPEDLENKTKDLTHATLIGGALDECLEDVDAALSHLGVNTTINHSLVYAASDKYNDDWYEYEIYWVKA